MGNPSGSRAEAAYARAMSAFQEGSLDAARRLVAEALAADPSHAGAKTLRTRIDSRLTSAANPYANRSGRPPEVTSVDPTTLIDRVAHQPPDYIEPTVMIQRDHQPRVWPRQERHAPPPPPPPPPSRPSRAAAAPAPEPTVLISPKKRAAAPSGGARPSSDSFFSLLWLRLKGLGGEPRSARRGTAAKTSSSPGPSAATRGVLMAVGGLVVAALLVFGVVALWRYVVSPTYVLTINKPVNGTIVGDGLQCGTRGDDCEIARKASDTVTLEAVADSGYVWTGFTGACAPAGRVAMTEARTCGATFGAVNASGPGSTVWPLTIIKPTGGTIVAAGGIICGTLGSVCSVTLPDGVPVTLTFEADNKFKFLTFTGDCSAAGETTMTGARTCGATFAETQSPVVSTLPSSLPNRAPSVQTQKPVAPPPTTAPVATAPPPATQPPPPAPSVPAPSAPPIASADSKPAPPPQSEEDHARKEIAQLVKTYCAELETLQPQRVQKVYPNVDQGKLREQFRQYKSLKCTLTGDLAYDRIDVNGAGGAQVKTGMKQTIATQAGGAPQTLELDVTIVVSRMDNRTPWTIDRVNYAQKPK